MFPTADQVDCVWDLWDHFKAADIKELRGFKFHHKKNKKTKKLGLGLQPLGHKVFPSAHGHEFALM